MPSKPKRESTPINPQVPIAAVFSFLKGTRGMVDWSLRDLAKTLNINATDASRIVDLMHMQGYVKPAGNGRWLTSVAGENVSASVTPRYSPDSIREALSSLKERIGEVNRDSQSEFIVSKAVAFGDFLDGSPRTQAADVGIELTKKQTKKVSALVGPQAAAAFLKKLKNKSPILHLRPFEDWMGNRTHRKLV